MFKVNNNMLCFFLLNTLTLSRRRSISYRNQYNDLLYKSMDWFLYNIGLRRERVKKPFFFKNLIIAELDGPD